ncbi:phosphatidylserine decarboxylase [Velocimicrobium porci]|uniref:Phosphatidylserine decarboxylase n=1 Tax=Velocimicrobium porci TaxID=2606634 RepID=A0A6L5Y019_9FIRM|nr:phosphatidylserine decarboxylase [Velocimicrobium porci]MSS63788.1 phosphatidylserine decarboxylase [Velocimicrobium porci]
MKYIDRNGRKTYISSNQDRLLKIFYSTILGRCMIRSLIQPKISELGGAFLNTKLSACFIKPFIKHTGIDLSQYEEKDYKSYNEFFIRRIKEECRPIAMNPEKLISPCDGKLSVYKIHSDLSFQIKHTWYKIESLLHSKRLAKLYQGGYACVFRLTVDDYHRYCYMDDGLKSKNFRIPGVFHTVNPIANDYYPIYKENTREFCLLKSKNFGTILIMEVGALFVGRINNYDEKKTVKRGEEKGRFEFGGSTIVVLFQKDKVELDCDLLKNTKNGFETIVKMGETIGKKRE